MAEPLSEHGQRQRALETALALSLVALLLVATIKVLLPFAGVFTFAVILAIAVSGAFERLVGLLHGRRKLAAVLFALIVIAIAAGPVVYISAAVADLTSAAQRLLNAAVAHQLPDLPPRVSEVPVVGPKATVLWQDLQRDAPGVLRTHQDEVAKCGRWLLKLSAGAAGAVIQLLLAVIIAAALLAAGASAVKPLSEVADRLAGPVGPRLLDASARAVRGVAIGVIGTALLESVAAWIGFAIAGVPGAVALTALTFFLALVQAGPVLVVVPVAIWLGVQGQVGWAVFMAVWTVVLMGIDNVVKPILIAKSGQLPLLVLFLGVIGGLAAWGFTGMFIGATVLAVFWTVKKAWLATPEV